jgi:hypothetical protein
MSTWIDLAWCCTCYYLQPKHHTHDRPKTNHKRKG